MTDANTGTGGGLPRGLGGEDDRGELWSLIRDIEVAMMTTVDEGLLRSRPMQGHQSRADGDLWFFTSREAHKVTEIGREHQVNLSYADPRSGRYVSVSGLATAVDDRERMREFWNDHLAAYFPRGIDDPNLLLIRVTPERAEYWESASGMEPRAIRLGAGGRPEAGVNVKVSRPAGD